MSIKGFNDHERKKSRKIYLRLKYTNSLMTLGTRYFKGAGWLLTRPMKCICTYGIILEIGQKSWRYFWKCCTKDHHHQQLAKGNNRCSWTSEIKNCNIHKFECSFRQSEQQTWAFANNLMYVFLYQIGSLLQTKIV